MDKRIFLPFCAVAMLAWPAPLVAQGEAVAPSPVALASGFTLAVHGASRAAPLPVAVVFAPQPAEAMPRDIPEVIPDDARPTPGIDWTSAQGAKIKLRPHRVRLTYGF